MKKATRKLSVLPMYMTFQLSSTTMYFTWLAWLVGMTEMISSLDQKSIEMNYHDKPANIDPSERISYLSLGKWIRQKNTFLKWFVWTNLSKSTYNTTREPVGFSRCLRGRGMSKGNYWIEIVELFVMKCFVNKCKLKLA